MLDPVVRALVVKNFKSFAGQSVELDNPCFLVGRNGAGKSNFVEAFGLLADLTRQPLGAVIEAHGGFSSISYRSHRRQRLRNVGLRIEMGALGQGVTHASYALELRAVKGYSVEVVRERCIVDRDGSRLFFDRDGGFHANIDGLEPAVDRRALVLPLVAGDERLAPVAETLSRFRLVSIRPEALRQLQDPDGGARLLRDGRNAASVLREILDDGRSRERLEQLLGSIVAGTTRVRPKKHGNKLGIEFQQLTGEKREVKFEAYNMSDGTLRVLGILIGVFQPERPSVLLVEEPESTIHAGAIGGVMDALRHAARQCQLVVTTHSPQVLDTEWIDERSIRMVEWRDGQTRIGSVSDATKRILREHIEGAGELLVAGALDAEPLFEGGTQWREPPLFPDL